MAQSSSSPARNIILTSHPTLHAYTYSPTSATAQHFTVTNPSPKLLQLLSSKAPGSLSFSDQIRYPKTEDGKPRTIRKPGQKRFQPGIWLDDLPDSLRPVLVETSAPAPAPTTATRLSGKQAKKKVGFVEKPKVVEKKEKEKKAKAAKKHPSTIQQERPQTLPSAPP
ncbi:MAG: hypothetical protein Q9218_004063 [Villophora microphyllina]